MNTLPSNTTFEEIDIPGNLKSVLLNTIACTTLLFNKDGKLEGPLFFAFDSGLEKVALLTIDRKESEEAAAQCIRHALKATKYDCFMYLAEAWITEVDDCIHEETTNTNRQHILVTYIEMKSGLLVEGFALIEGNSPHQKVGDFAWLIVNEEVKITGPFKNIFKKELV